MRSFIASLVFFIIYGYIMSLQRGQLPVGLIAQLVEHCTGITQVMGSNPLLSLIFLGLNLAIAYVVCITAIITHVFINLSFYINLNTLPYLETGSRINLSQVSCSPLSCWNCNLECWLTVARWDEYDGTAFHPAYNTFSLVVKLTIGYVQI